MYEGPAMGAAILTSIVAKVFKSVEEGADNLVKITRPRYLNLIIKRIIVNIWTAIVMSIKR